MYSLRFPFVSHILLYFVPPVPRYGYKVQQRYKKIQNKQLIKQTIY
jgi:hypothetical protein